MISFRGTIESTRFWRLLDDRDEYCLGVPNGLQETKGCAVPFMWVVKSENRLPVMDLRNDPGWQMMVDCEECMESQGGNVDCLNCYSATASVGNFLIPETGKESDA